MMRTFILGLGVAAVAAGCSQQVQLAGASSEQPVPGANAPATPMAAAPRQSVVGPGMYNSDNKPIITRSGLNSDPNNPSGMPGRPVL
jgi:hypothetical protein